MELEGDPEIQQALRYGLFNVLQASARTETRAIGAKGLTGPGYDGHAFWDTETFVLPVLTFTRPELARDALIWRHSTLDLARQRAQELRLEGAAFPWRTIHGEECSGYWPAGTAAFHVNADIADAVRRYVLATGDEDFERDFGAELLVETARLWTSLGNISAEGRFHIDGVTGPDEYSALVDNNVYTNLMAQANLRAAAGTAERRPDCDAGWGWRGARSRHGGTRRTGCTCPTTSGSACTGRTRTSPRTNGWDFDATPAEDYPLLLSQPYLTCTAGRWSSRRTSCMALFLRGDAFTADEKRRDFDYYEALTVRDSSLSACIQSVVAAEVGHLDLAYDYLAEAALLDLERSRRRRVRRRARRLAGGTLLAARAVSGGCATGTEGLFRAATPAGIERLAFQVGLRGRRLRVEVTPGAASYTLRDDDRKLEVSHYSERFCRSPAHPPSGRSRRRRGCLPRCSRAAVPRHAGATRSAAGWTRRLDRGRRPGPRRRAGRLGAGLGRCPPRVRDGARRALARPCERDMMGMSSVEWSRYVHDELGVDEAPQEISAEVARRLAHLYRNGCPSCRALARSWSGSPRAGRSGWRRPRTER